MRMAPLDSKILGDGAFFKLGALRDLGRVERLEQAASWSQVRAAMGIGCVARAAGRVALDSVWSSRRRAPIRTAPLRRSARAGMRAAPRARVARILQIRNCSRVWSKS